MIQLFLLFNIWASFLFRVVLGVIFLVHGWRKIKNLKETTQNFSMMGFRPGNFWGLIVALVELIGGLFLITGLFTSIVGVVLALQMLVALIWKISRGQKLTGGFELDLLLVVSLLVVATAGSGLYSLDQYWNILF